MKKIGIVSSFDILCGNATYSEAIADNLSTKYEVIKIDIPYEIRIEHDSNIIKDIIRKVKSCDVINIQYELGLYGPTPRKSSQLIRQIISASKKCSLTMHRVDQKPLNYQRLFYNTVKESGLMTAINSLFKIVTNNHVYNQQKKIIDFSARKNSTFIVHTYREKKRLKQIKKNVKVYVHPIVWPENLNTDNSINIREKFKNDNPIVGIFGFISEYKNFETIIRSLDKDITNKLDFNILMAGSIHPGSNKYGKKEENPIGSTDKNSMKIISKWLIDNNILLTKFYHHTAPNNETLIHFIESVDVIAIPYFETGQSGSGIASLAIQYGKKVVFSDTHLITELSRFLNKKPFIFDANSSSSFMCCLLDSLNHNSNKEINFHNYNFETNIKTILRSLNLE